MNHDSSKLGFNQNNLTSFQEIENLVHKFESILNRLNIRIAPGSTIEQLCLNLVDLSRKQREPGTLDNMRDIRIDYRPAFGVLDLMRKIVRLENNPSISAFHEHLELLNQGTVAQNIVARTDHNSSKIFELLIGLIAASVGSNVKMDHPSKSKGDNPDVLVTLNGVRWGFACKMLFGNSPLTLYERLEEGIEQIEHSEAEKGCVVFNLKNKIDHDLTWPLMNEVEFRNGGVEPQFGSWRCKEDALKRLLMLGENERNSLLAINSNEKTKALFIGKKTIPSALLFLQTTTAVQTGEDTPRPIMTNLGVFMLMNLFSVSDSDMSTLDLLNTAMHNR